MMNVVRLLMGPVEPANVRKLVDSSRSCRLVAFDRYR